MEPRNGRQTEAASLDGMTRNGPWTRRPNEILMRVFPMATLLPSGVGAETRITFGFLILDRRATYLQPKDSSQ
jgi:hypothetical protein